MAKRKRIMNMEKMLKEGRGQGVGSAYKPWIRIQDVPYEYEEKLLKNEKLNHLV